jgi:hypothetical protein
VIFKEIGVSNARYRSGRHESRHAAQPSEVEKALLCATARSYPHADSVEPGPIGSIRRQLPEVGSCAHRLPRNRRGMVAGNFPVRAGIDDS